MPHGHYNPGDRCYYCDVCQNEGTQGETFDTLDELRHHGKIVHDLKKMTIADADKDPRNHPQKKTQPEPPKPYEMTDAERSTAMRVLENPDWLSQVWERMDQHIVKDYSARRILFKAMVSAFALKTPINVFLKGDYSTGKSFLAKQVGAYIPSEYIRFIEGASPKSMYYDYGVKDDNGQHKIIDLSNKVWVFLDIKDNSMIGFLRSMMSHDSYEREYQYVDDLKTFKTILRGFAAIIICTANPKWEEEYSSRAVTISPEVEQEKFKAAILMDARRVANPDFKPETADIHAALRLLAETKRQPRFPEAEKYAKQLLEDIEKKRHFRPRDMRDLKLLPRLTLITAWLHQRHRITDDEYIDVQERDYQLACEDWAPVHETTTTGLTTPQLKSLREMPN